MQLWHPRVEQLLGSQVFVLEEVDKYVEGQVLFIVYDREDHRTNEVHSLSIRGRREQEGDGLQDTFELILAFLRFHPLGCISPGEITANLAKNSIVQGFMTSRKLGLPCGHVRHVVVDEFGIVLLESVLVLQPDLLLDEGDPPRKDLTFLNEHRFPLSCGNIEETQPRVQ